MDHTPIADYALIGDTRTAALCSTQGSIDWLCVPRFDSDPIFGRLIGDERAGRFSIAPDEVGSTSRSYCLDSAVLETTWRTPSGVLLLTEGMVLDVGTRLLPQALLVRRVLCTAGTATVRINFDPKLGLAGHSPRSERRNGELVCTWGSLAVAMRSQPDLAIRPGQERVVELRHGEQLTLVMTMADRAPLVLIHPDAAFAELERTDSWWREWSGGVAYDGEFRDSVVRSLITLRLLTYSPSGAPVAAPTTSLPETLVVLGIGTTDWWLGAIFGAFHGLAALTLIIPLLPGIHTRMASERAGPELDNVLEPPGLLSLNYGRETPLVALGSHVIFGVILGTFLSSLP